MNRRLFLLAALLGAAACAPATPAATDAPEPLRSRPDEPTEVLFIGQTRLAVERPAHWQLGGVQGPGTLHSFIGGGDGYPNFAVMTDPDPITGEDRRIDVNARIEELFEMIAADHAVEDARWVRINGLDVYSVAETYRSVAGPIRVRRLLLSFADRPYILSWSAPEARFAEVAALVEWCAWSLHVRPPEQTALP